jgi:hypothetical protein
MLERCPVCEGKLDASGSCPSCGFVFEEPRTPSKLPRRILLFLAAVALIAGIAVLAYKLAPVTPDVVDGHYEVTGINGGTAYVPVEQYGLWRTKYSDVEDLRRKIEIQKQEKVNKYGNLEEERRLERLITITANQIESLLYEISEMEKASPEGSPQPSALPGATS